MKNLQVLALFLGLIAVSAFKLPVLPVGGMNSMTIAGNGDPGACLLTLTASLTPNAVVFTESVNNSNWDCTYQNLTFQSMFRSDYWIPGEIDLIQTSTPTIYTGSLTIANISSYDGTACLNYGYQFLINRYGKICRFKYGDVLFSVIFYTHSNGTIDTNWDHLIFPVYGSTVTIFQGGQYITKSSNDSFPHVVGELYSQCGGWSTQISDLHNPLYVTGTNYVSNQINLQDYFKFFLTYSVIVRQNGAADNTYRNVIVGFPTFYLPPDGNCTNTLLKYEDIISDLNYCANGCDVSFLMIGTEVYVMETGGFTSVPSRLRRD